MTPAERRRESKLLALEVGLLEDAGELDKLTSVLQVGMLHRLHRETPERYQREVFPYRGYRYRNPVTCPVCHGPALRLPPQQLLNAAIDNVRWRVDYRTTWVGRTCSGCKTAVALKAKPISHVPARIVIVAIWRRSPMKESP